MRASDEEHGVQGYHAHQVADNFSLRKLCRQNKHIFPRPAPGVGFDYRSVKVEDYVRWLGGRKAEVPATIANAPALVEYAAVVNGFSAILTDAEVLALKNNAAVVDVQAGQARACDTVTTCSFLACPSLAACGRSMPVPGDQRCERGAVGLRTRPWQLFLGE